MLFGAHQAEAAAGWRNPHADRAGEPAHRIVTEQNVAEEQLDALMSGAAGEAREQQAPDALALPVIGDGDGELRFARFDDDVAGFADDDLAGVGQHRRNERQMGVVIDAGEAMRQSGRQLVQAPEEAIATRIVGKVAEKAGKQLLVLWQDRADRDAFAAGEVHHIDELGRVSLDCVGHDRRSPNEVSRCKLGCQGGADKRSYLSVHLRKAKASDGPPASTPQLAAGVRGDGASLEFL
jgi:hypothetical protein